MGYLEEECGGCIAHFEKHCSMLPRCNSTTCPCLTCLIKGMCHQDCEAVEEYVKVAVICDTIYNSDDKRFYTNKEG